MVDYTDLMKDLTKYQNGSMLHSIIDIALKAVDPYIAVERAVLIDGQRLSIAGRNFDLHHLKKIYLVSVGKAAYPMAQAVISILGERLSGGVVVTKSGFLLDKISAQDNPRGIMYFEAGHPLPDDKGIAAAQEIVNMLSNTQPDDLVISLISGGGSALLTMPVEGIQLNELQAFTELLLRSGATIQELNTLRKHLELLKGGGLAKRIAPASGATLVLSDVIGDSLDVIASGPTVADTSTYADCFRIINQYGLTNQTPSAILKHLEHGLAGKIEETPKPGNPVFLRITAQIIASNYTAAQAAFQQANNEGFNSLLLTTYLDGEARYAGRLAGSIAAQITKSGQPVERPACIILGGETTVHVHGGGRGGRNLETALGAVEKLAGLQNVMLISLATDGDDGSTQAAGALVTGGTYVDGLKLGMHPNEYLDRNDSYTYFKRLDSLIVTGPTLTNVNDLILLLCF